MYKQFVAKASIMLRHENPVEEALHYQHTATDYTTRCMGPKLRSLSKDKGYGKILLGIYNNPGLTKQKIREKLALRSQCSEMFQIMSHMKMIYNIRGKGYFITELGTALLYHFNILD